MSRNHRRREEPASSSWEPEHRYNAGGGRSYHHDDYSWRHYAPPIEPVQRRSFNYWREEPVPAPTSYHTRRLYGRESYDYQWHDDSRPRQRRDSGPSRDWDDRESQRNRNPSDRNHSRQRYSTESAAPYVSRPTFRARDPIEPMPPAPKPSSPSLPRETTSPSNKSSEPQKPSTGYLALSKEPSEVLHGPENTRKLLVLDLNGTLLIRSPRSRTAPSRPQLRPVHPRPYMQSFREYLFCADTRTWLDTMVWSSAQPHSVDDMVNKVFGATKSELKAVWNRKSLGLSEAEYHQKAVTTKDLVKPWDFLASASTPSVHSALTTLLLDDSPHKAALQPYNHVCIPEYDSTRRHRDLRAFSASKRAKEDKLSKKARRRNQVGSAHPAGQTAPESAEGEPYDTVLLAIVGVLEAIKVQSNVAGWIRNGGLWAREQKAQAGGFSVTDAEGGPTVSSGAVGSGNDTSSTSDPAVTSNQADLQMKMWFNDASVLAYWVARGRKALLELDIRDVPGVTG